MTSRLDLIADWPSVARRSHYAVAKAAHALRVSTRQLELYFNGRFHESPRAFFAKCRWREAQRLGCAGLPGKAIARLVGLASYPSLCRALKRDSGRTFTALRRGDEGDASTVSCAPERKAVNGTDGSGNSATAASCSFTRM